GFAIMIEDRGDLGPAKLEKQIENLTRLGNTPGQVPWLMGPNGMPKVMALFSVFRANVPQYRPEGDPFACSMRGVTLQDLKDTLEVYTGSLYVNDFNLFGRTWQVVLQAESEFRDQPEDLFQFRVRNYRGQMVPLGSLGGLREITGPLVLTRYNMY